LAQDESPGAAEDAPEAGADAPTAEPPTGDEAEPSAATERATPETEGQANVASAEAATAAEPAASPGANAEPELTVTAQRYEQGLKDAPVAVTVFLPTTMDRRGIVNLQDIGKFTPNLELHSTNRPGGGSSAYAAYIRGIGTGDFQFPTDPGVGLYIDDVYMARTMGGLLSMDVDIERIEVIKGPQGTLFGRNTIGGALNVVTTKPETTGDIVGTALIRIGDYGRKDFAVGVNGPLVDGKVGAKLAVAGLHSDGYGTRVLTGEKTSNEERFITRGGLRFTLAEGLDIRLNGDYSHQDQKPPNGQFIRLLAMPPPPTTAKIGRFNTTAAPALNPGLGLPAGSMFDARWVSPNPYDNWGLQPVYDRYDLGGGSATLNYRASDAFNIKSISAVRALQSQISVDGDQTPYSLQTSRTKLDQQQYSEELQFSGDVAEQLLHYMVGGYAFREVGNSTVYTESYHGLFEASAMPMAADAGDTSVRFDLTATSYAAFTQETLRIIEGLHVTAGARINHDEKDFGLALDRPQLNMPPMPFTRTTAGWNSFTPKVGVDWSPVQPIMIYASYSQGFKSGGFSATPGLPKYGPETVTAYELGVKSEWLDRRLTAMVAGFLNDYRDIQLTVQTLDPMTNMNVRTTQNAGNSMIKGFEIEAGAKPVAGLVLNLGAGYVDAKFDSVTAPAMAFGFMKGQRLPQVPNLSLNAGAQYTFDVSAGDLTLRGDLSYKGDQFLTAVDPSSYQAGYFLYGARIAFVPHALQQLELSLQGINLSDQVYYIYHASLPPTGQELAIAGPPRTLYFMAKYSL
jgi:iron complex outermembrane receptor protein